jgi:hypothetical protein
MRASSRIPLVLAIAAAALAAPASAAVDAPVELA